MSLTRVLTIFTFIVLRDEGIAVQILASAQGKATPAITDK
jgi:hypothetical protein